MSVRSILKNYFTVGKKPSAGQFADLINSFWHKTDDTIPVTSVDGLQDVLAGKASIAIATSEFKGIITPTTVIPDTTGKSIKYTATTAQTLPNLHDENGDAIVISSDDVTNKLCQVVVTDGVAVKVVTPLVEIVNDLVTGGSNKALASAQGQVLKSLIDNIEDALPSYAPLATTAQKTAIGLNKLDKNSILEGWAIFNDGTLAPATGYAVVKVPCKPSQHYVYSGLTDPNQYGYCRVRFEKANNTYDGMFNPTGLVVPFSFLTPSTTDHYYINVKVGTTTDYNTQQIREGTDVPGDYQPYSLKVSLEDIDTAPLLLKADTSIVKKDFIGKNKLNKNIIIEGKAVHPDAYLVDAPGYSIVKVPAKPNQQYIFSGTIEHAEYSRALFYDANDLILGIYDPAIYSISNTPFPFTSPNNTSYFYLNTKNAANPSDYDTLMIRESGTDSVYEPYFIGLDPSIIPPQSNSYNSPLKTKKVSFVGNSITALGQYQVIMQSIIGFLSYYSDGVAGSLVQVGTDNLQYDATNRIPMADDRRIKALLLSTPDIIFFWGGTNDWAYQGYTSTTGVAVNLAGYKVSYAYFLDKIRTGFPSGIAGNSTPVPGLPLAKIVCVGMMARGTDRTQYAGPTGQKAYSDAAKDIAQSRGCYFIDMLEESGISYENIGHFADDYVHPNASVGMPYIGRFFSNRLNFSI